MESQEKGLEQVKNESEGVDDTWFDCTEATLQNCFKDDEFIFECSAHNVKFNDKMDTMLQSQVDGRALSGFFIKVTEGARTAAMDDFDETEVYKQPGGKRTLSYFVKHINLLKESNLKYKGVVGFFSPNRDGEDQAEFMDEMLEKYGVLKDDFYYMLSAKVEFSKDSTDQAEYATKIEKFFKTMEEKGYKNPVLYTDANIWNENVGIHGKDIFKITDMKLWLDQEMIVDDSDEEDNEDKKKVKLPIGAKEVHFWSLPGVQSINDNINGDFNIGYVNKKLP
jgi:hypothetical protein